MSFMVKIGLGLIKSGLGIILFLGTIALPHAQADWKSKWEKTVKAAKKEGKIVLYMRTYEPVLRIFMQEFPEIKAITITGRGSALGGRIMAERRAGKYLVDIYVGGPHTVSSILIPAKVLDPIPDKLILPEVRDESKWITGKHRYTDPQRKYNFALIANPNSGRLGYNVNLVNPKEFKSRKDLLNPKWRGKIISLEPTLRRLGGITQFIYYHPALGPGYFKKLFGEMDITFSRDPRQLTDWLGAGKFAICLGCLDLLQAREQGLPVSTFTSDDWIEGASFSTGGGSLSLINRAPHPNAAKVFINWFLSPRGQITLQKLGRPTSPPNSGRVDIPKDDVIPENRLLPGRKYFDASRPEWQDMKPILKLAREILKARK